ncbi:MAG: DUF4396 domain-containing protein [candidate division Zixibacteria bacterium]|nr:DUF4396 domain-containing protein [candidate division Zixibacteria bacterium]
MLIDTLLDSFWVLGIWLVTSITSVIIVARDIQRHNAHLPPLMRLVWLLTVAYSSLLGLVVYWFTGRGQISRDSIWRQGFRSTAHCYSGCGGGEVLGILLTVALLGLAQLWVVLTTFSFAYVAGLLLTAGPLIQDGVPAKTAWRDAVVSESASIVVMETVAIGVDLYLAGNAQITDTRFWLSLVVSLSLGFLAAYPVNILLIHFGVKEGMHDPRHGAD